MLSDFLLLVLIILLVAVLFCTVSRRARTLEGFGTLISKSPTSTILYKQFNSVEFDKHFFMYKDVLSDRSSLLQMYGCGINLGSADGSSIDGLVNAAARDLMVIPISLLTNNYITLNSAILNVITKAYDSTGRRQLEGQVYVVLAQAPFYMDENNNPISVQFSYDDYLSRAVNSMTKDEKETNPQIQYRGYVIFTAYDRNGTPIVDMKQRKNAILNIKYMFRQKQDLCYITCSQNKGLPCGCASQDAPYRSSCLESKIQTVMSPGQRYTYAILYRINPLVTDIATNGMLANDTRDIEWLQAKVIDIPTVEKPILIPPSTPSGKGFTAVKGVVFYQHCKYFGWKSQLVPAGKRYTMEELKKYGVRADMSAYKTFGNATVKLYVGNRPVDENKYTQGYIRGNLQCLTKFDKTNDTKNDKITSVEIR